MRNTCYGGNEARFRGAEAFLAGREFNKNNIISNGTEIYSYGRHFRMAAKLDNGEILVTDRKYSATTSKHVSGLRDVLTEAGYRPVGKSDSGTIWKKS